MQYGEPRLDIAQIFEPIQKELALVEARLRQPPPQEYRVLTAAIEHLLSSGGKRIRPALVLLVSKLYPTDVEQSVALAAAVEMLHTATLVHDDLIDGALLRRGIPTINASWSASMTVLTGDYMFARAAALAAHIDNPRLMRLFAQTLMIICAGELKQQFDKVEGNHDRPSYYERIHAKTAALLVCAAEGTGLLANAPQAHLQALREYGYNLGMAFQIVDDVLDLASDETALGKPIGSDLLQGLATLPTLWYLENHPADNVVSAVLRQPADQRNPAAVTQAIATIKQSGAIQAALSEAQEFAQRSQAALARLPSGATAASLHALAEFAVRRKK